VITVIPLELLMDALSSLASETLLKEKAAEEGEVMILAIMGSNTKSEIMIEMIVNFESFDKRAFLSNK